MLYVSVRKEFVTAILDLGRLGEMTVADLVVKSSYLPLTTTNTPLLLKKVKIFWEDIKDSPRRG